MSLGDNSNKVIIKKFDLVKDISDKILALEIKLSEIYDLKKYIKSNLAKYYDDYISGKYGYVDYNKKVEKLLNGKTEDEYLDIIKAKQFRLLDSIKNENLKLFQLLYNYSPILEFKESLKIKMDSSPSLNPLVEKTNDTKIAALTTIEHPESLKVVSVGKNDSNQDYAVKLKSKSAKIISKNLIKDSSITEDGTSTVNGINTENGINQKKNSKKSILNNGVIFHKGKNSLKGNVKQSNSKPIILSKKAKRLFGAKKISAEVVTDKPKMMELHEDNKNSALLLKPDYDKETLSDLGFLKSSDDSINPPKDVAKILKSKAKPKTEGVDIDINTNVVDYKDLKVSGNWSESVDEFVGRDKKNDGFVTFGKKSKTKTKSKKKVSVKHNSNVPIFKILNSFFKSEEKSLIDKIRSKNKTDESGKKITDAVDGFVKSHLKEEGVVSQKTVLSKKFKELRKIKMEAEPADKKIDLGMMGEQINANIFAEDSAKAAKKKLSYNISSYGALANVLVKNVSLELINSFPGYFKKLYKTIRLANIPILSNTYTNMMVLTMIIALVGGFFTGLIVSTSLTGSIISGLSNAVLFSFFMCGVVFLCFAVYPGSVVQNRMRDIKTNLPFAIDNMSAVVSSGVAPAAMFKLIISSDEYGEISKEIEKIVEFTEIFGYDVITSIITVSKNCPSPDLKDFFEGFVSTIKSGGDLHVYLREKAEVTMIQYKLDRRKYTESISTFSDIYTGIMVASPLFFVAALSLVSILGGSVGGMDVSALMMFGTYIAIPAINLLFVMVIELTQPNL